MQQAITRNNLDQVLWHHMASHNESINSLRPGDTCTLGNWTIFGLDNGLSWTNAKLLSYGTLGTKLKFNQSNIIFTKENPFEKVYSWNVCHFVATVIC